MTDRDTLADGLFFLVVRLLINGISVAQSSVKVLGNVSFVTVHTEFIISRDLILQILLSL